MSKIYVACGAVLLLAIAGIVAYHSRDIVFTPATVAVAPQNTARRPADPPPPVPAIPQATPVVTPPATFPATPPANAAEARLEHARHWLEYAQSPAFVRERIEVGQTRMMEVSQELFALLGLTPEETKQVAVLLTEKRIAPTEVALADLRAGVLPDTSTEEFFQRVNGERAKSDGELKALLGEQRFRQLEEYYRGREEENVFIRLDRTLGQTPDALTPSQTEQLRRALREQSNASNLTPAIIAGARGFLTPVQLEALGQAHRTQVETRLQRFEEALPPRPPTLQLR